MQCDECSRLLAVHEQLSFASAAATQRLWEGVAWRISVLEYRRIATEASDAHLDAEAARLELESHSRTHDSRTHVRSAAAGG